MKKRMDLMKDTVVVNQREKRLNEEKQLLNRVSAQEKKAELTDQVKRIQNQRDHD